MNIYALFTAPETLAQGFGFYPKPKPKTLN